MFIYPDEEGSMCPQNAGLHDVRFWHSATLTSIAMKTSHIIILLRHFVSCFLTCNLLHYVSGNAASELVRCLSVGRC